MSMKVAAGWLPWPSSVVREVNRFAEARNTTLLTLLLMVVALSGCQMLGVRTSPPVPPLLEPATGGMSVQLNQRMTLRMDDRRHHMVVVTSFTPDQIRMTGFTLTGQRLLDISHEDGRVSSWQSEQVDRDIPARWLLTQLQLAYWPKAALQEAYVAPWAFSQEDDKRTLHLEGELLVMVSYAADFRPLEAGSELTIKHHRMGLVMTIETLKAKELTAQSGPGNTSEAGQ